jgi:hypothetical protein
MVLGTQLFVTGLLAELVVRSGKRKPDYLIGETINQG